MQAIIKIILITFIPAFELRASIPFGIFYTDLNWFHVATIVFVKNIILGVVLYYFMEIIFKLLTKIKIVNRLWSRYVERTHKKIHEGIEKYGEWAVAVFIGKVYLNI